MVSRSLRTVLFVLSALALVGFMLIAVRRFTPTRPLDPVEVAALTQGERFAAGGPLYVEPTQPDDASLMPAFPLAVSLAATLFGPALWEPRAIALLATLLLAALVLWIVRAEAESWTLAVAGAGFVLLGDGLVAGMPGDPRPEALMLVPVLLGFVALRRTNGHWGAVLAGLLLAVAFFTDPQAAWFVGAALFAVALDERGRLPAFALALVVFLGGGFVELSRVLGPWFNFQAWDAPLRSLRPDAFGPLQYVGGLLLGKLGVPTLAAVLSFAMPTPPWRGKGGLWMCLAVAALVAGLAATQSRDYGPHALLPSVVALALIGTISIQRVTRHLSAWPGSSRLGGQGVVLAALTLQFVVFLACIPHPRRFQAAAEAPPSPGAAATAPVVPGS